MHNDIDRDLYEILGVSRVAGSDEIKSAYRAKAKECHPDVAHSDPDSEHKFKELTFAYEVLSDHERRRAYDALGLDGLRRGAGADFDGFTSVSDLFDAFFGDGFASPFGRRGKRRGRERGRDMEVVVEVGFEEVLSGTEKELDVTRMATCEGCDGSGRVPGTRMGRCDGCGGAGEVRRSQRSMFGTFIRTQTCPRCGGEGELILEPCEECRGAGRRKVTERIQVSVPPGVERGDRLRVREKGEGGVRGGPGGDLYVAVDVRRDQRFERDGTSLFIRLPVDMIDAALGAYVEVPTVEGWHEVKVPSGTQQGDTLVVKGQGLPPRYGGRRGDLYATVDIKVPGKLNSEQKKALEAYRAARKEKASRQPGRVPRTS